MNRQFELTIEELLQREDDWWEREDEGKLNWIQEGIELFYLFLKKDPFNLRYSEMLSFLLLKKGEDQKFRDKAYDEAVHCFQQIVELDETNTIAHYRLGFLYFYKEQWAKSIHAFQQALEHQPEFTRYELNKEQLLKAYYYILQSANYIRINTMNLVLDLPEFDISVFQELEHVKKGQSGERNVTISTLPYQMIRNGKEIVYLTFRDYERLADPILNENILIFDQQGINESFLFLDNKKAVLTRSQIPLLETIMRQPNGISKRELIARKYYESVNPENTLNHNIKKLRENLSELDSAHEWIETIDGGYQWNCVREYRMFKQTKDVSVELLLV